MDIKVKPIVVLIVLLFIIFIAFFVAATTAPETYGKSRAKVFLLILSGLSIFITFLFYYAVVRLQHQEQKLSVIEKTFDLHQALNTDLPTSIQAARLAAPAFVQSLHPFIPNNLSEQDPDLDDPLTVDLLAKKIFTIWEQVALTQDFLDLDHAAFGFQMLQYARSPRLFTVWNHHLKQSVSKEAQQYGDLIFALVQEENPVSVEDYCRLTDRMRSHWQKTFRAPITEIRD